MRKNLAALLALAMILSIIPFAASANNTSVTRAQTVYQNETVTLSYPRSSNRVFNYYKFTMPADGDCYFTLRRADGGGGYIMLSWTDNLGKRGGTIIQAGTGQEVREKLLLAAGEYMFLAYYDNLGAGGAQFSWTTDAAGNNSRRRAQASNTDNTSMFNPRTLESGETVTLSYPRYGKRPFHYYKFNMPANGNCYFTVRRAKGGGGYFMLSWTDNLGKRGRTIIEAGTGQEVREVYSLAAGEYMFLAYYDNLGAGGAQFSWETDASPRGRGRY